MNTYFVALTWLRALAALFVVITHTICVNKARHVAESLDSLVFSLNLFDLGDFAVYLFFTLSGCTLTLSNGSKVVGLHHIMPFYFKRFMRIWPSFVISLLIYVAFIPLFKAFYNGEPTIDGLAEFVRGYQLSDVIRYLLLSFNITDPKVLFNTAYWSLPLEFQYYLLLPLALLAIRGKLSGIIVPICMSLAFLALGKLSGRFPFEMARDEVFSMAFSFFGGVLVSHLYFEYKPHLPQLLSISIFISLLFLASLLSNHYISPPDIFFLKARGHLYGLIAIVCVALALFTKPIINKNKVFDIIYRYGQISYSIYLYHMMFAGISILLIINLGIRDTSLQLMFTLINTVIGSYLFSLLTYKYIEEPSISLGKRWFNKADKSKKLFLP